MTKIKEIIRYKFEGGIHKWIVDTTRRNLIGYNRNEKLQSEISNWDIYKHFVERYGLILNYPEEYVSIYILRQFLKSYKIVFHPDEQEDQISLNSMKLIHDQIKWIYSTCIEYDQDDHYSIAFEEFKDSGYFPAFRFSDFEKTRSKNLIKKAWYTLRFLNQQITNYQNTSKVYEIRNPAEIHLAVRCGGHSDVYKCPNYFILKSKDQQTELLQILSKSNKPSLEEVMDACEFMIFDFKGEDLGYARQLMIYSKQDHSTAIDDIADGVDHFSIEMKSILETCESLKEYEHKTADLLNK